MRKYWRELSAAGTILIVVGPSLWLSPAFENCIKAIPGNAAYQHQSDSLPFLLFFGSRWFGCLGPFVDVNSAAIVAVFTVVLAFSTILLWLHTKRLAEGADDQAAQMSASIAESARAATAMEGVAAGIKDSVANATAMAASQREFWQQQMRAYVSVIVGGATFQEREKKLKFAGRPRIVNEGMTPAYKVKHMIKSAIVALPLPADFDFHLPEATAESAPAMGPRQHRDITGVLADYVPDQLVAGIKNLSARKCLLTWGRVTYEDAFGVPHFANFAQILYWVENDSVFGVYEPHHNDSD